MNAATENKPAATERREIILTEKKEVSTMKDFEFTPDTITAKGKTFPAEYSISTDSVTVFVKVDDTGTPARIRFEPKDSQYDECRAAALAAADAWKAKRAEQQDADKPAETASAAPVVADEKPVKKPARKTSKKPARKDQTPADERPEIISSQPATAQAPAAPAAPAEDPTPAETPASNADAETPNNGKAARGPVPEKPFIGTEITGKGWKVLFDGVEKRTRFIFEEDPTPAALAELNTAGFYYSPSLNSWNKKLTFKAYRAAQALAVKLSAVYA